MSIIKLTNKYTNQPIYINTDQICAFEKPLGKYFGKVSDGTIIKIPNDTLHVKENKYKLLAMLGEDKNKELK